MQLDTRQFTRLFIIEAYGCAQASDMVQISPLQITSTSCPFIRWPPTALQVVNFYWTVSIVAAFCYKVRQTL